MNDKLQLVMALNNMACLLMNSRSNLAGVTRLFALRDLLFGGPNFLFGLQPVIRFRARFVAPQDVEFVGSHLYAFFQGNLCRGIGSCSCVRRVCHDNPPPA